MYSTRIGHVHLRVRDLDRSIRFYSRFLNLELTERVGDAYAFLTGSEMHHEVALQSVGPDAPTPNPLGTGLYHVAFEVPDKRSFVEAYRELTGSGVRVNLVDHLISWAMYFSDPDDNGIEIYWDTRQEPGGEQIWRGRNLPIPEEELNYDV